MQGIGSVYSGSSVPGMIGDAINNPGAVLQGRRRDVSPNPPGVAPPPGGAVAVGPPPTQPNRTTQPTNPDTGIPNNTAPEGWEWDEDLGDFIYTGGGHGSLPPQDYGPYSPGGPGPASTLPGGANPTMPPGGLPTGPRSGHPPGTTYDRWGNPYPPGVPQRPTTGTDGLPPGATPPTTQPTQQPTSPRFEVQPRQTPDYLPYRQEPQQPRQEPQGSSRQESSSAYSYAKPIQSFDVSQAKDFAPALTRENLGGLKFTDLLSREQNNGLPFNDMIAREQAPEQLYGKQQALEAANEANALLAQGLNRRHADIAGQMGARGMGEGGAAARIGDLATSETLGQQASNIRQAIENAAKYGDERSLNIFGQNIGQRGQDISQQGQLNNAILELLGQGVTQRGQDTALASQINQAGLDLNQQGIQQRGQDVDQQKTVAQMIQALLGQDQRESWSNSSASGGSGGSSGGGGNNNYAYNNLLYDMFLR